MPALDVMWPEAGVCAGAGVQSDCEASLLNVNVLLTALQIIRRPCAADTGAQERGGDLQPRGSGASLHKTYYV